MQAKIDHAPIPKDEAPHPQRGKVISLMDALRKSISDDKAPAKKPPAKHDTAAAKGITLVKSTKSAAKATNTPRRKSA